MVINTIINKTNISLIWWVIVAIASIFLCFTNIYNDILIVGKASYNMWDYVFSGDFFGFFSRDRMIPGEYYTVAQSGSYPFIAQLILAIWLLPAWIVGMIVGGSIYNSIYVYCWIKLLLLAVEGFAVWKVYRIISIVKKDMSEAYRGVFYFLSCGLIFLNTFVASQIEIITCFFILCAIEYWLKDKLLIFSLFMMLAIGMKYFAAIVFFSLLFMKEKNIFRIISYSVIALLPMLELLTKSSTTGTANKSGQKFLEAVLPIGAGAIMPFVIIVLIVLVFSCLHKHSNIEEDFKMAVIFELLLWGAFCLFSDINPYWSVLIVPFLTFGVLICENRKKEVIVAETVYVLSLAYVHFCKYPWVYDARNVLEMGIGRGVLDVNGVDSLPSVLYILQSFRLGTTTTRYIAYNVALVALIMILYFIWKNKSKVEECELKEVTILYKTRLIIMIILGYLPMISLLFFALREG